MNTTPQAGIARAIVCTCLLLFALVVAGCERAAPEPVGTLTPPGSSSIPGPAATGTLVVSSQVTPAPSGSPTVLTRAATPVLVPSATPTRAPASPTPTPTQIPPTETPTRPISGPTMQIKVFMVALGDEGKLGPKIGCGDSIVSIDRIVARTTAVMTAAEKELVSIKSKTVGPSGYYNALYLSNLSVDSVQLVGTKATVRLKGQVQLGGICDTPRVIGQIRSTAMQFSTVKDVAIFLNNVPIDQALSQR